MSNSIFCTKIECPLYGAGCCYEKVISDKDSTNGTKVICTKSSEKTGEWIFAYDTFNGTLYYECSECYGSVGKSESDTRNISEIFPYCDCGAKMKIYGE